MSDWRAKPRVGRAEFLKYASEIQSQIEQGNTNKKIYEHLTNTYDFKLSLAQFNRYVRKYFNNILMTIRPDRGVNTAVQQSTPDISTPEVMQEKHKKTEEPRKIRNPSDLKKFRKQSVDLEDLQNYKESE
ncbi:hypothetical protein EAMG_05312 [Escherichia coli M056]|uniref:TraK family protein n=1 Tax=Escherichia coli TaxID=562 RepID=UPI000A18479A|nr:TraK family protein [Escherichia coli]OSK14532.1 hypothetical protein EAMG_05312 [Escherichia coli M056]